MKAPRQGARKQDVAQLRAAVSAAAGSSRPQSIHLHEIEPRAAMRLRGDGDDARRVDAPLRQCLRRRAEPIEQQVGQQERREVVHRDGRLVPVLRELISRRDDPGVVDEHVEPVRNLSIRMHTRRFTRLTNAHARSSVRSCDKACRRRAARSTPFAFATSTAESSPVHALAAPRTRGGRGRTSRVLVPPSSSTEPRDTTRDDGRQSAPKKRPAFLRFCDGLEPVANVMIGGEGGISNPRSPARRTTVFETAPFDRSGTSPSERCQGLSIRRKNETEIGTQLAPATPGIRCWHPSRPRSPAPPLHPCCRRDGHRRRG